MSLRSRYPLKGFISATDSVEVLQPGVVPS